MDVIEKWTGRHACALQFALRNTQEDMAQLLGVARRTVATWHDRPDVVLRPELQRALDTAYERSSDAVRARFLRHLGEGDQVPPQPSPAVQLSVAIAIVVADGAVLLVQRRDPDPSGITWQFPAGVIKPGANASNVAVRETLAETGIHCSVKASLGQRIHPLSGVLCEYLLCEYLAGVVENRDSDENLTALWAPVAEVTRFIPAENIFEPVLKILREAS